MWSFACSPHVCVVSFRLRPPAIQRHAPLPVGEIVSVDGCFLSICQPCDELAIHPGFTSPSPAVTCDWLLLPHHNTKDKQLEIMDGWYRVNFGPVIILVCCFSEVMQFLVNYFAG